ncbi:hypothetical protein Q5P01_013331 [Channa striata]|uniref:Uncharacterized protein n=1 Tax=Channa striata TaxID=64152 RepID=A0AA88MJU2_CHASR|nr:hypothetical protein Q5P01_013331 [Channa striata]
MSPISKALNIMQTDKDFYMGWLVPTFTLQPLIDALQVGIRKRFGSGLKDPEMVPAAILLLKFHTSWTRNEDVLNLGNQFLFLWKLTPNFLSLDYIKTHLEQERMEHRNNPSLSEEDNVFSVLKQVHIQESSRQLAGNLASTAATVDVPKSFPAVFSLSPKLIYFYLSRKVRVVLLLLLQNILCLCTFT